MFFFWIVAALICAVVEVATLGFFAGFLALGALGAAIVSLYMGLGWQGAAFLAVSAGGVLLLRRPLMSALNRNRVTLESGAREMVGSAAVVTDSIESEALPGHVRVRGESWPAVSADGAPIAAGAEVNIVDIRRATLVVAPR